MIASRLKSVELYLLCTMINVVKTLLVGDVRPSVSKEYIYLCIVYFWPRDTLYPQTLAVTSPTSGGRSVGIFRTRTKATEFSFLVCSLFWGARCNVVDRGIMLQAGRSQVR
jgi:hypothetical protein